MSKGRKLRWQPRMAARVPSHLTHDGQLPLRIDGLSVEIKVTPTTPPVDGGNAWAMASDRRIAAGESRNEGARLVDDFRNGEGEYRWVYLKWCEEHGRAQCAHYTWREPVATISAPPPPKVQRRRASCAHSGLCLCGI